MGNRYEIQPERYGAYAFLVKRFAQLQKVRPSFSIFTLFSDVLLTSLQSQNALAGRESSVLTTYWSESTLSS